ncbi:acyl-CoA desaturase, partial [Streptomyces sp. KAI-27]|nr:acyl-CoA desaturase [Streptomyces sp. KAI-27]
MTQTAAPAPRPPLTPAGPAPGSEFSPLLREVRGQGLLEHRTGWYVRTITLNLLALAAVLTGVALLGESWWALLLAPPLAVLSARTAFVGHDAGHSQIT